MRHKRILVVDDEVYIAHILEFSLGMEGYRVVTATDGNEALKKAAEDNPDLIVLDIMMPGMDGYEVCRRLKADEQFAETPIILLTAMDGEADRDKGMEVGASAYMTKPFRPAELIARIRGLLEAVAEPGDGGHSSLAS
ncbi:MAG: response regulator [Candidatus Eisenbacteria sp.]|nr:response regulator [Candidatus Eisenbacteria bacterium]